MRLTLRDSLYALLFCACCVIGCGLGGASGAPQQAAPSGGETAQVDALITKFQTAYSAKDYQTLQSCFHPKANIAIDYKGGTIHASYYIPDWIAETKKIVGGLPNVKDVLSNREIVVYRNLATVVADYDYRGGGDHEAGQDLFTVVKFDGQWKILSLAFYGDPVK